MRFFPGCSCCGPAPCGTSGERCPGVTFPDTLYITFDDTGFQCGCLVDGEFGLGFTYELTCSGGVWRYESDANCFGSDCGIRIELSCCTNILGSWFWRLIVTAKCSTGGGTCNAEEPMEAYAQELACDPLEITFTPGSFLPTISSCGTWHFCREALTATVAA
jgi:hypothetical protein